MRIAMKGVKTPRIKSEIRKWDSIPNAGGKEWRGTNESMGTIGWKDRKGQNTMYRYWERNEFLGIAKNGAKIPKMNIERRKWEHAPSSGGKKWTWQKEHKIGINMNISVLQAIQQRERKNGNEDVGGS